MKKIELLCTALAVFAMASCSPQSEPEVTPASTFSLYASQLAADESRVTISPDDNGVYTRVAWEQNDAIAVRSAGGNTYEVSAQEAGTTNVRFSGEGAPADVDSYYAIYPATYKISEQNTFSVNYATQTGGDDSTAALLVGNVENATKENIAIDFHPVNALLHVTVSGVSSLSSAKLCRTDNGSFITAFTYDIENDEVVTTATGESITVTNPDPNGFFIAVPGDLDLSAGYTIVYTSGANEVMAKAYAGKTFAKGTTTTVTAAWSQPSVTVGAKSSYSFYDLGNSSAANSCDNATIYFDANPSGVDCSSSFQGIQIAEVSDVGFVFNGTTYKHSEGTVTWPEGTKTFKMNNISGLAWGSHTVTAFIETKHNGKIESSKTIYITGLPYTLNPANDDNWEEDENVVWDKDGVVELGNDFYNSWSGGEASITKSDFKLPANLNVVVNCQGTVNGSAVWLGQTTTFTLKISGNSIYSKTSTTKSNESVSIETGDLATTMTVSNPSVMCHNSRGTSLAATRISSLTIDYGNK